METPKVEISQSEWEVMRIIWTLGPLTSSTLATILAEKMGWKVATTKTFLGRLVKKGALTTEMDVNFFITLQWVNKSLWMPPWRNYLATFVK